MSTTEQWMWTQTVIRRAVAYEQRAAAAEKALEIALGDEMWWSNSPIEHCDNGLQRRGWRTAEAKDRAERKHGGRIEDDYEWIRQGM